MAAAPPAPLPEVDTAGRAWNADLHSGNKATVQAGTWKKKRGVTAETIAEAYAAEDAARGGPPALPAPPAAPVPDVADDDPFAAAPPAPDTQPTWAQVKAAYAHMTRVSTQDAADTLITLTQIFTQAGIDGPILQNYPALYGTAIEAINKQWPMNQM